MEKKDMLEMLVNYYSDGNKAKFAAKLGIKPQAFSMWFARNSFDAELLFTKCEHISAEWLLNHGEGEMLKSEQESSSPTVNNTEREFYQQQINFLNEQLKEANERCKRFEEELFGELRERKANVG